MKILTRTQLSGWLDDLAKEYTLIAPHILSGVLLYQPVESSAEVAWDFIRPALSAKEAFFPPTERLMLIEKYPQEIKLHETLPKEKQILFAVRPCDVRGIQALDALFIETEPVDSYYARRRENTLLVGLACKEMGETCFCTSVGGAPDDSSGMDLMLTEVEGGYVLEAITDRGARLVGERLPVSDGQWRTGITSTVANHPKMPLPTKETWPAFFNDPYWPAMSERCLSCRICAYVCPTCRCFDVRDEVLPSGDGQNQFERIRCWDSCAGATYRRIAGGHNPRAEKGQRLRNRFFCKFYYYPEQYAFQACTGCGRCIDACPVNIDITEILAYLAERA